MTNFIDSKYKVCYFGTMKRTLSFYLSFMVIAAATWANSTTNEMIVKEARNYREEAYRLQNIGHIDQAYALYTKAAAMDPTYHEVYNDLGVILEMKGDLTGAENMYLKVIEMNPDFLPAYANLGFLYEKKMDKERASYYWRKRYDLGQNGEYWWSIAKQHLIELGDWEEMLLQIKETEALKLSSELAYKREQARLKTIEEARMHYKIGVDALSNGNYTDARKEFNTALSLNPDDEELMAMVAEYYKKALLSELTQKIQIQLDKSQSYLKEKDYLSLMSELRKSLDLVTEIPADQLNVQ